MGMFMDQLAILSLAMPLAFPTATALGHDPVWFGIVVTKTVEIGLAGECRAVARNERADHGGPRPGVRSVLDYVRAGRLMAVPPTPDRRHRSARRSG